MTKLMMIATASLLTLGLGACGNFASDRIAEAGRLTPSGSAFASGLHAGYVQKANLEGNEYDFNKGDLWARKATAAARGEMIEPEDLARWKLPNESRGDLVGARERLMAALAIGAAEKMPSEAAKAQVSFDCWVEEQAENHQPDDIRACRNDFEAAMGTVQEGLKPKPVAAAVPAVPGPFVVYFDTASAKINGANDAVLALVLDAAKKAGDAKIVVSGHADRAGEDTYNMALSKKRADAVAAVLIAEGLVDSSVNKENYGERRPTVSTADGVREQENRRVEIHLVN